MSGMVQGFIGGALLVTVGFVAMGMVEWPNNGTEGGGAPATPAAGFAAQAPDISSMTPREQFSRLADRIQASLEAGDTAKVVELFPMLEGSFDQLLPGDRDIDARFHMGLLRAETGQLDLASAQADTIQQELPDDLFASYLQATVADLKNESSTAVVARQSFAKNFDSQMASAREDYLAHQVLLTQFLQTARAN
jgi:hypothetical protein